MSHLLDDEDDLPRHRGDREVTLSTGAILGIFFGLTLICGFFFAFGYNMGHKASATVPTTASDASDTYTSASAAYSSTKPSAGSPIGQPTTSTVNTDAVGSVAGTPERTTAIPKANTPPVTTAGESPSVETVAKTPPPPVVRTPPAFSGGSFVVQVAAVSHQEDAELLVSSLQKKGYSVAARNEPGDKLVHIQVGPFSDHKEADTMKQRLQNDGYNAMIKQL